MSLSGPAPLRMPSSEPDSPPAPLKRRQRASNKNTRAARIRPRTRRSPPQARVRRPPRRAFHEPVCGVLPAGRPGPARPSPHSHALSGQVARVGPEQSATDDHDAVTCPGIIAVSGLGPGLSSLTVARAWLGGSPRQGRSIGSGGAKRRTAWKSPRRSSRSGIAAWCQHRGSRVG